MENQRPVLQPGSSSQWLTTKIMDCGMGSTTPRQGDASPSYDDLWMKKSQPKLMVSVAKEKQGQNARNIWCSPSDPSVACTWVIARICETTMFTRCNCVPVGYNLQVHPEGEYIKANFNGDVFKESCKAGIGVVLWGSSGQPIAAFSACKLPIAINGGGSWSLGRKASVAVSITNGSARGNFWGW